jgi:hypothetical protein
VKTFYKQFLMHEKRLAIQHQLEAKYGCKFSSYSAHGGTQFNPVITRETPQSEEWAIKITPFIPVYKKIGFSDYTSVNRIHTATKFPPAKIVEGIQWLVKNQKVMVEVDRMGYLAYVALKEETK